MVVIFDLLTSRLRLEGKPAWQALVGVILGGLGIGLILASFRLESGIVFDTRSVLLSMSGLFFGTIPTLVAMAMTAVFRLWQGGAAAWAGTFVILATGGIGILWRRYRRGRLEDISARELYLFGVAVHLVMLALMLTMPWETARRVLAGIGLPVLVVYPLATAALGLLLANRLRREHLGAELAESEKRYRSLFENNHAVMLIVNPADGAIVDANPAACRFYGWTREQLQGMRISQINALPPEEVQAELDRARATQRYHFQFPHRRADGSVRDVEIFSGPVAVGGRQLLYSIIHDITERTRAEAELHHAVEEASRFREALDRVPACVYMKDLRFGYLYGNRATLEVFKCSATGLAGRDDTQFFPPVTVQRLRDVDARVFRGEQTEALIEVPDERQGARYFWEVKTPIYGDRERKTIVGLLGISTDVTAQKQAEAAIRESQQMFEAVVQHMPAHATLIRGSDLRVILANPAYLAISPGREVIGRTLEEIWPETGREFAALCRRVLETGEPYQVEDQLNMIRRGPDGPLEPRYFSWSLHRVRLPGDQGWGLLNMSRETTAFVQAEQALQDSEERLRLSLDAAQMGTFDWDLLTQRLIWSVWHKRLWGYQPGEFDGTYEAFLCRLHPDDRSPLEAELDRCKTNHAPFRWEFRVVWPDGSVHWMSAAAEFSYDPEGRAQRMRGTVREVTERKQAEAVLTERLELQDQIAKIVETVPGVICSFRLRPDGSTCMPYASSAIEDLYGVQPEEVQGDFSPVQSRIHPDDQPHLQATITESAKTLKPWRGAFRVQHPNKGERWVEGHSVPRRESDGSILWHGFVQDITERKRAEQALQQSHAMIVKLTAQVPGVVYQYRLYPDGRSAFPFASPGMKTIYEVTPEEVREDATPVFGRLHPEDADRIIHDIQESARTLQPFHCEFRVVLPRQGLRWRLSDAMPERTEDGGTLWHGIISDITERKQAEEALRQRNEELVRFTYTVSHDLKSPLVTIQTFLGYLEKDLQAGDAVRIGSDMGHIRRAAVKMLQLLEELLELSRIGRKMNAPEDVSLQTLAREAQDLVAGQIAERRVQVAVTDLPIVLHGDRRRLLEVFQNLLDNAVKFMGDQSAPRVEIGAEETSQGIVLHVRDNGSGIDPRHQEKLFGLFEKLHPGTPGTGIGLALVKRIVEVHGGRIWAESPGPGLGSTFRFTLSGIKRITNEQPNPPC